MQVELYDFLRLQKYNFLKQNSFLETFSSVLVSSQNSSDEKGHLNAAAIMTFGRNFKNINFAVIYKYT